jgi:ubiquinone biosynthesis protein
VDQADEFKLLQANVPADPPAVARRIVEEELGQSIEDLFREFEDEPLASASIGQVHLARLTTGENVVVKIQHEGIAKRVREDTEVLSTLAHLAQRIPDLAQYRPVEIVAEFQRALRRELDFGREERNLQHFGSKFAENTRIRIPKVYSELSTSRVLTMEFIEGTSLANVDRLAGTGCDLGEVARNGAQLYLNMIFADGHYHADPHPGNVLVLPGNVIGLLDFGMVGRIDEGLRENIEEMLLDIVNRDAQHLTSVITRIGQAPGDLDEAAFSNDVADFVAHYGTQKLAQFDLSGALKEMVELIRRYHIVLPAQAAMLLKTLIMLEGTAKLLNPAFSLMELIRPLQRDILLRRLSPMRHLRRIRRVFSEMEHMAEVMPRRVLDILRQIQIGKFYVHLDHRGLSPSVNRLVMGLLTSSLFLGSSLMLSMEVPPLVFRGEWFARQWWLLGMQDISLLGLAGCVASVLMGLRLFLAINKSGHLDHKE